MKEFIKIIVFIAFIANASVAYSDDFPKMPNPPRLVNDYVNLLSRDEISRLEQKLVNFDNATSTQIAVVVLNDLKGYDINEYAAELAHKWGIGQKGKDNGVMILVNPKNHKVSIQIGYGLEGVATDAIAKRIIENEIVPEFKKGQYYSGLDKATNTLMSLSEGEFPASEYMKKTRSTDPEIPGIVGLFIFIAIFSILGRIRKARHYSVGHNLPFWLALTMMNSSRGSHSGSFGSFSSGSGSFGGFGGGGFGGGGASGSW